MSGLFLDLINPYAHPHAAMLKRMASKLKTTRRERLIHNERRKLISNLCLGGAIAFLFVLAWEMRDWGATVLMRGGDLSGFIFLSITLVLIGLMSLSLFMVAWTVLDKMVDPDEDPEPDKPATKPKK